jgi:hypothetical protein
MSETIRALISFLQGGEGHSEAQKFFTRCFAQSPLQITKELITIISSPGEQFGEMAQMHVQIKSVAIVLLNQEIAHGETPLITTFPSSEQVSIQSKLLSLLQFDTGNEISKLLSITITKIARCQLIDDLWPELIPALFQWIGQANQLYSQEFSTDQFGQRIVIQNPIETLAFNSLSLLIEISLTCFDSLIPHIKSIETILGLVYQNDNQNDNILSSLRFRVKCVHLIRCLIGQPEVQDNTTAYFNAIVATLTASLTGNHQHDVSSILTWLIEIVVEEEEVDFFKPHIANLTALMKQIALCQVFSESVQELALELLISLLQARPQFANGSPAATSVAKAKRGKAAPFQAVTVAAAAAAAVPQSVTFLNTVFEIICFFMQSIDCDQDWCQLSPIDTDSSPENTDLYDDIEQHFQTGLHAFARFIASLTPKRLKTHLIPQILSVLNLPSLPISQLPQPVSITHNLINDQYNVNWRQHVIALRLYTQLATPELIPFQSLPIDQVFTLISSSHPKVQYTALLTLSSLVGEYGSDLAVQVVPRLLQGIEPLLNQMHLPHVQQTVASCLHVVLSELSAGGNEKSQIEEIFTQNTIKNLFSYLLFVFNYYFDNSELTLQTIGLQIQIISCIAELCAVAPHHFTPLLSLAKQILEKIFKMTPNEDTIHLQCKAIEVFSYIYTTLNDFVNSTPETTHNQLVLIQEGSPGLNKNDFFAILLQETLSFVKTCQEYYQYIISASIFRLNDRENVLKCLLRALVRLSGLLKENFVNVLPFVMTNIISNLNLSIKTKVNHNYSDSLPGGGLYDGSGEDGEQVGASGEIQIGSDGDVSFVRKQLIESEKLGLFFDDVCVNLSMLQQLLSELPLFITPWVYDLTKVLLYYVNYPQNVEIQTTAATILPSLLSLLSKFIVSSNFFNNSSFDTANISSYKCVADNSEFFSQFISQSSFYIDSPLYTTYYFTPSNPAHGDRTVLLQHVPQNPQKTTNLFAIVDNIGPHFSVPTIPQATRIIIYIFEYLLYILKLEDDEEIVKTLLSTFALSCDEVDFDIFKLTNFHVISIVFDYVLLLSYKSQEAIAVYTQGLIKRIGRKHGMGQIGGVFSRNGSQIDATNGEDSDEEEISDDDDDADGDADGDDEENNNDETDGGDNDKEEKSGKDDEKKQTKIAKLISALIPQDQLTTFIPQPYSSALFHQYRQFPFDENTLTHLTGNNDLVSQQLLYAISRILATSIPKNEESKNDPNFVQNTNQILNYFLPRLQYFSTVLLLRTPEQHPTALTENQTENNTLSPYSQYLPTMYTLQIQKLPFLLFHSLFNLYKEYLSQIFFLNQTNVSFFLFFIQTSFYTLQKTNDIISLYISTYHYIKNNNAEWTPMVANMMDSIQIEKDKSFYVKLFHNFNPGILLEHISYSLGLFIEFFSSAKFPQNLLRFWLSPIPSLQSLSSQTSQTNTITCFDIINTLSKTSTAMLMYISIRYKKTLQSTTNHISPSTLKDLVNIFTLRNGKTRINLPVEDDEYDRWVSLQANPSSISPSNPTTDPTQYVNYKIEALPTCELWLYGYDNTTIAYFRWVLSGIQYFIRQYPNFDDFIQLFKDKHISLENPIYSQLSQLFTHFTYIITYLAPLLRDMGESSVLFQLFVNLVLNNNIDQKIDDIELLDEIAPLTHFQRNNGTNGNKRNQCMEFVQKNFVQSCGVYFDLILASSTTQSLPQEHQAIIQQITKQPTTFMPLYSMFNPFCNEIDNIVLQNSANFVQQNGNNNFDSFRTQCKTSTILTTFFPILAFLSRGYLLPDLHTTCRQSIAAVINVITLPIIANTQITSFENNQIFYKNVLEATKNVGNDNNFIQNSDISNHIFLFSKQLLPLKLSPICNRHFYDTISTLINSHDHPVIFNLEMELNTVPQPNNSFSIFHEKINSDLNICFVDFLIKHLLTSFYNAGRQPL